MTFREFNGKNVEEAIRTAMKEFSSDLSDLDIEILSQGSRGILGVGGEDARILAAPKSAVAQASTVRPSRADAAAAASASEAPAPAEPESQQEPHLEEASFVDEAPRHDEREERRPRGGRGGRGRNGREAAGRHERADRPPRAPRADREPREPREPAQFIPAKPMEELTDDQRKILTEAKSVLEEMLRLMDVEATVEIGMGTETAKLNVKGNELGILIGRRGEKLASLQHIVNLIVAKREGQWTRVAVDVENYRGRREEQLREVAERAAKRVTQSGKIIQLEAMPAVERRIIHMILAENPKIRTQSVGVEPARRVVILPAAKVEA
ncbi:MAG TPA: RNA-binding cell elongation regulator Jag/EloR [Candidatus Limnocylindria bacterium]|nr:RNA-binding cell elongation regulator Jag/EloR [Candidatus Limnocylindria bacterium]